MFSGIVEEVGVVRALERRGDSVTLTVDAHEVLEGLKLGDSVDVDGACLTVTAIEEAGFTVGLSPETLRRTALGTVSVGSRVNLERALRVGDRLGGHVVQGHVDGTGRIREWRPDGDSLRLWVEPAAALLRYIVEKGFIAIDGISLTVAERTESAFCIALVAYTREHVALVDKRPGAQVNIEVDVLAKYVESLLAGGARDYAATGEPPVSPTEVA
jgi:riboflavin synthase